MAVMTSYVDVAKTLGARLILNQQGGSGQWLDESGNGLHASEANSPEWHADGGPAVGVPGFYRLQASLKQCLNVGDDPLLRFASENALSIVWFERNGNQASDPEHAVRIGKGDRAYQVRREAGIPDSLRLTLRNNDAADEVKLDTYPVTGDWQMFMARYSGTLLDIWQIADGNATSAASISYSGGIEDNTDLLSIGAQHDRSEWRRWWSGDIAGISLFPAALSSEEFERLRNAAQ